MLEIGDHAPDFSLSQLDGTRWALASKQSVATLLVFLETDCPTCHLTLPYLNKLADELRDQPTIIVGISQDGPGPTRELVNQMELAFPVLIDRELAISRLYDPAAVPTLFLLNGEGKIIFAETGFDKQKLNEIALAMSEAAAVAPFTIADQFDGAPQTRFGCTSRHLETPVEDEPAPAASLYVKRGARASLVELDDAIDPYEFCLTAGYADPLPVLPPTVDRVKRLLDATPFPADEIVALVPPNYGAATVEKIAANAVMAGCRPEMMRVLIPLVRAACDERFNLHGVQATTHFAAPLIIINGPVRSELEFACGSNVMSNVARANSTLGRALQLMLANLGGARPGGIDMSTLGSPAKFSYCIAENEEQNPWEPLHVELGFDAAQSTVTLFAAEPPRGVSEHNARSGRQVLKAISRALATVFSYRVCAGLEAIIVLCPEHVKTLLRDGMSKQDVREFLWQNTGIPKREFDDEGEGTQYVKLYAESTIDGEQCYLKFPDPQAIKIVVAGGTAGKFSAVIGSWAAGPRGSQMVTYPIGLRIEE